MIHKIANQRESKISNNQRTPQDVSNAIIRNSLKIRDKDNGIKNEYRVRGSKDYSTTNNINDDNATEYIDRDNNIGDEHTL